jgi:protease-4
MNKKRWLSLAIVLVLLVVYVRTDVIAAAKSETTAWRWGESLNLLSAKPTFTTEPYRQGSGQTIALLNVNGTIQDTGNTFSGTSAYNHQLLLAEIEDAFTNPDIKAIILAVDSPGGGVYESEEIYQKLKILKQTYPKPIVVSMGSMAASGGYYISMPADKIIANRYTMTGSIGVIMAAYNYSGLAES